MSRSALRLAVVFATVTTLVGQGPPNFSGNWLGVPNATTVGPPRLLTIVQDAKSVAITNVGQTLTYPLDGSETQREELFEGQVLPVKARVAWSDSKLVITEWRGATTKIEATYSLDEKGQLVVMRETNMLIKRAGALSVGTISPPPFVYRKQ